MEVEMEKDQKLEWDEAQNTEISVDLAAAARQQLKFLAAVDRNRWLYEGPALLKAIYRYKAYWLPLLAKYSESEDLEGPLVVPLDCEWIWHCHRLNPLRYKSDCEELYGRILDKSNVVSSVEDNNRKGTEEIWQRLYPEEPYEFDLAGASSDISGKLAGPESCTKYDLISAVKRQAPFYYQVARPHVENDIFLEGAVARYKGFLHLIKRNWERSVRCFCVPTYDIDLIWHTHQLHPTAYCKDLQKALGKVLEHDDTDSDRTEGKKLDNGFYGTIKQWERTFGMRYWKAGAMYRGSGPAPLTKIPCLSRISKKAFHEDGCQKIVQPRKVYVIEVLLEVVGVRGIKDGQKDKLFMVFSKSQPDVFFHAKQKLTILPESMKKQVRSFHCEPTGEFVFELVSTSISNLKVTRAFETLGTVSLPLKEFLVPVSKLAVEKWLVLTPCSRAEGSEPISLRIALSFTVPVQAPHELQLVQPPQFPGSTCFFPLPGRVQHSKSWTRVIDGRQTEIICLQMRDPMKHKVKDDSGSRKQVIGMTESGETHTVAELIGTCWSLLSSRWFLKCNNNAGADDHLYEIISGNKMVYIYQGRKLDYEITYCGKEKKGNNFVTAVEFSTEYPYGRAVALIDQKSGYSQVKEDDLLLPVLISAFILSDTMKKKGHIRFTVNEKNGKEVKNVTGDVVDQRDHETNIMHSLENEKTSELQGLTAGTALTMEIGGGCGSGCGSGCGNMKSGGCGSGCGSGCGNMKSGGCGSGCGSGCGNTVNGSGCGGCGSGCGNMVKTSGCGGCGSGCGKTTESSDLGSGNFEKSSGCSSGCGSGCGGHIMKSDSVGSGNVVKSAGCRSGCGGGCGSRPGNIVGSS